MKIAERHIAKTVLASLGLVTLMLIGLQLFILFVNQLDHIGKDNYGIWEAAQFVLLQTPYQVYLFFPMASLLGCLIGLGIMANHRELVVVRSAGMSISQITLAIFKVALVLILCVTLVGELFVPSMVRFANDKKLEALSGGQSLKTGKGVWLKYSNDFIHVKDILPGNVLRNVNQFRFDDAHDLVLARHIATIKREGVRWVAYDVEETSFHDEHISRKVTASIPWDISLRPNVLRVSSRDPDEMSLYSLGRYLRHQHMAHRPAALHYRLSFWQRLMQPLTTVVMMILAIPFVFGPLRSSTMGSKLLIGATVGFSFYIINRFFGSFSQVFQLSPEVAAVVPTLTFAVLGLYLMRRTL